MFKTEVKYVFISSNYCNQNPQYISKVEEHLTCSVGFLFKSQKYQGHSTYCYLKFGLERFSGGSFEVDDDSEGIVVVRC